MEPNAGAPKFNQAPQSQGSFEVGGNQLPQYNVDPLTTANTSPENFNQAPLRHEQLAAAEQLAQPSQAATSAVNSASAVVPATSTAVTKPADTEQMEKQWVDKTKQVIADTQNDPYQQAHQVALLMQGYLRERYGKIVGKSGQ